jgi:3-methyladenine DNA glycosylase AlkD
VPKSAALSTERIRAELRRAAPSTVPQWRPLRVAWSRQVAEHSARDVIAIAMSMLDDEPWGRMTAYELIAHHPAARAALRASSLHRLARGLSDWVGVDTYACYLAGPAWREGQLSTRDVRRWLRSEDRWQRRIGVVCTVALNVRARGGRGDAPRTLAVCRQVVDDRDDMVVKALSWALRSLVIWAPDDVAAFMRTHEARLAPRVRREVATKLRTGRKH